jgi:hypothetical protein
MTDKRRKIGVIFFNDTNWIGGTYYIINLVKALHTLPDNKKPELVIFSLDKKSIEPIKILNYPYLSFLPLNIPYSFLERVINKLSRIFTKKQIIIHSYPKETVEIVFPSINHEAISPSIISREHSY